MTGQNYVAITGSGKIFAGTGVVSLPQILAQNPAQAIDTDQAPGATIVDRVLWDLGLLTPPVLGQAMLSPTICICGYAKNGAALINLTGTAPVSVDLTAFSTGVTAQAGDTSFVVWNAIQFVNLGAVDLVISPGASNPARLQLGGTTPTITVAAGSVVSLHSLAGLVVDSTHKVITITPTAGGSLAISVGGA
jgi:hypothetical protein